MTDTRVDLFKGYPWHNAGVLGIVYATLLHNITIHYEPEKNCLDQAENGLKPPLF